MHSDIYKPFGVNNLLIIRGFEHLKNTDTAQQNT